VDRPLVLLVGLVGGVLLAGIGVGILVPMVPEAWRSEGLVWASSAALVAVGVGLALFASRPRRE
jgi:hypothetical protein